MYLCCVTQISVNVVGVYEGTSKDNAFCFCWGFLLVMYVICMCVHFHLFVHAVVECMLSLATI